MSFKNRLKLVKDESAPIDRRVTALCNALTFCHVGYNQGKDILKNNFNIVIGNPISNQQLLDAANYLEAEWEEKGRGQYGSKENT